MTASKIEKTSNSVDSSLSEDEIGIDLVYTNPKSDQFYSYFLSI